MNVIRPMRRKRRGWPGGFIGEGPERSTFGEPLNAADDLANMEGIDEAIDAAQGLSAITETTAEVFKLDGELADTQRRRWRFVKPGAFYSEATEYVAGDVAPIRYGLMHGLMPMQDLKSEDPIDQIRRDRSAKLIGLLACATPYFLPSRVAWDLMASEIPTTDRDDIRLAAPALVMFSSGCGIPPDCLGLDPRVIDRIEYNDLRSDDPEGPSKDSYDHPPIQFRGPVLSLIRQLPALETGEIDRPRFGYQLMGALLLPNIEGEVLDSMCWVTRSIDPLLTEHEVIDTEESTIGVGAYPFTLIPALRSNSTIGAVAESLAAAVAWGAWTNPGPPITELPKRKLRRTKEFQQDHEAGVHLGVRTITIRPSSPSDIEPSSDGLTRSVRAHYRRGYWRRARVGPRNNWHYERRFIPPTIVNPSNDPVEQALLVYRLPVPELAASNPPSEE